MKTKFNLDRDKLNSDYIKSKQDYQKVLNGFEALKPPIWKNPWFYGPIGLASLAVVFLITFQSQVNAYGNNSTLLTSSVTENNFPEDTPCIKAPINGQDVEFQIFEVYPEKGFDTELASGTTIHIPANSLKSNPGVPVKVKIREFPDKSSVFLAGIPMDYKSNTSFESAGMIEIRAEKDGKSISLSEKSPMKVSMALYKSPDDFKFWKLDETKKEWIETPCEMSSADKSNTKAELVKVGHQIEVKKEEIEICEKEISKLPNGINTKSVSNSMIPTENARKLIIDFDQSDFPELKGYKDIEFEYILPKVQSEANMTDYAKRIKHAQSQIWNDVDIKKQSDYYIATFSNSKEKYALPIKPVLKGESLAQMQQKMESASTEKNTVLKKLQDEKKKAQQELAVLKKQQEKLAADLREQIRKSALVAANMEQRAAANRAKISANSRAIQMGTADFRTTTFGVYNCDRPIPYPSQYPSILSFESKEGMKIQLEAAFVFDQKKDTRYSFGGFYQHKKDEIGWFNHESTLVIIDDKGEVYYKRLVNEHPKSMEKMTMKYLDAKNVTIDNIQSILGEADSTV